MKNVTKDIYKNEKIIMFSSNEKCHQSYLQERIDNHGNIHGKCHKYSLKTCAYEHIYFEWKMSQRLLIVTTRM